MLRMNRFVALLFLMSGIGALAQDPLTATPCDLVHDPARFANQIVQVRSTVSIAFEDFTLDTPGCGDEKDTHPIWLVYGGDEPTPTPSTVNDTSRPNGMVLKVGGRAIHLHRDAALDLFVRRLAAVRTTDLTGKNCYDDCRLYRVSATLTGVFFAAPKGALGGYGHLGCCHLLAIQRVSDVDARRTAVPAGGRFECSTETWNIGTADANRIAAMGRKCESYSDCRRAELNKIAAVAEHWEDQITFGENDRLIPFPDLTSRSADLLTAYSLKTAFKDSARQSGPITAMAASRTVCKAVAPPLPQSTPVGCRNLNSEFAATSKATAINEGKLKGDEWRMGDAQQAANNALKEASTAWGISTLPRLNFDGCEKPMLVESDRFSWCHWSDPEGMQSMSVEVTKFGALRHGRRWDTVPWVLSRGYALACMEER